MTYLNTDSFISNGDSSIFQRIFCLAHFTDEDHKFKTIVCSWKYKNDDKLIWNSYTLVYILVMMIIAFKFYGQIFDPGWLFYYQALLYAFLYVCYYFILCVLCKLCNLVYDLKFIIIKDTRLAG